MFRQRLLSALVGIPTVMVITWAGGPLFALALLLVGVVALQELYILAGVEDRMMHLLGYTGHTVLFLLSFAAGPQALLFGIILFFILLNIAWVLAYPRDFRVLSVLVWGKLYITLLLSAFLWLRQADNGLIIVVAVLITIWASDTGAYLVGMTCGRHKLIPEVSPKKSVEGAVGGIVFAAFILGVLGPSLGYRPLAAAAIGVLLSIAGQFGDLAESALKRWSNVKDSGRFLPGHGGVLDRIDSLLFAAPLAYIIFILFLNGV